MWYSVRNEFGLLLTPLRDRVLWALLMLLVLLLGLAVQVPFSYAIDVGREDGPGSDLPLVRGFFPVERFGNGFFRWTTDEARVRLYGVGVRPLLVSLRALPVNQEVAERGARELELWSAQVLVARLPVRPNGANYHVLLPPTPAGDLELRLRSTTFVPTGDQRAVGVPIDRIAARAPAGPYLPAAGSMLGWPLVLVAAWLVVRRAGIGARATALGLGVAVAACVAGYLMDAPRMALGIAPALTALALGGVLVLMLRAAPAALAGGAALLGVSALIMNLVGAPQSGAPAGAAVLLLGAAAVRPALGRLAAQLLPPISAADWSRLVLIAVLVCCVRYGGKSYPDSMPGDIGFHSNRYADIVRGKVLMTSRNRGVDFPYPPAFYVLLAPWTLLGIDRPTQLRVGGALLDAFSPLLIAALALRVGGRRVVLAAAALYAFAPAVQMTTWWNFSTHIFTQWAHLLLMTALVVAATQRAGPDRVVAAVFVVLQLLVYLGHFGFWMNTTLLGGILLLALLRSPPGGRQRFWGWAGVFVAAQVAAVMLFYSAYGSLFLAQAQATASGGLTGLAERAPVGREILWATLWDAGFRQHFGFFLIPAALAGTAILVQRLGMQPRFNEAWAIAVLAGGTCLIAGGFAVLPFLSGSTLSTRWLMFSAWVVVVAAALAGVQLWPRKWGRVVVLAASAYVLWVSVSMWLAALAWRIRPPEPF